MEPPAYPLAFGHWHVQGNQLTCRLPRKTVEVAAPGALLRAVLQLCDGRLGWREVAAELAGRWSAKSVDAFLSQLSGEGLPVEASESLAHWTELGQLPALRALGVFELFELRDPALRAWLADELDGLETALEQPRPDILSKQI